MDIGIPWLCNPLGKFSAEIPLKTARKESVIIGATRTCSRRYTIFDISSLSDGFVIWAWIMGDGNPHETAVNECKHPKNLPLL